jgi:hypothetical protein
MGLVMKVYILVFQATLFVTEHKIMSNGDAHAFVNLLVGVFV